MPPMINVVSPEDGQEVATGKPQIRIEFYDTGSGIDQSTIRVIIDKSDLTIQALNQSNLVNQNIPVESGVNPYVIIYSPTLPLTQGGHEIYFAVRDKTGNLAEARRSFRVQALSEGIQIGVTNTFIQDWQPDKKMTDILDWGIQSKIAGADLRVEATTKTTNYPNGLSPFYRKDGYNAYLEQYVLGLKRSGFDLAWGYTMTPVESELFQLGRDIQGVVATGTLVTRYGSNNLSFFSGKATTTYGIGMAVYNFSGVMERWEGKSGLKLNGMFGSIGDASGYDFINLYGRGRIGQDAILQWELIHGIGKLDKSSSDGFSGHFDVPLGGIQLGLDLVDLEPNYALPGQPVQYSPERGGIRSWGIRILTPLFNRGFISVNGIYSHDNLDGSYTGTTRRSHLNADYNWFPRSDFNLNLNYQGEVEECPGPDPAGTVTHRYLLTLARQWRDSSAKLSYAREKHITYHSTDGKDYQHLFGSWTKPAGIFKLTPELEWSRGASDNEYPTFEARFNVATGFCAGLSNSTLAVYQQRSGAGAEEKIINGLELHMNLWLWNNSSFRLNLHNQWWTNYAVTPSRGLDTVYSLEWVCQL